MNDDTTQNPVEEKNRTAKRRLRRHQCPECTGAIKLRVPPESVYVCCDRCRAIIDVTENPLRVVSKIATHSAFVPRPRLGASGILKGVAWLVVGYLRCRENSDHDAGWNEYLLYNEQEGFRFLIEVAGHWSLVEEVALDLFAVRHESTVTVDKTKFTRVATTDYEITDVRGEFNWRVPIGKPQSTSDFAHPPYFLSVDDEDEASGVVTRGEYLPAGDVAKAFGLSNREMPYRSGVAPHQPSPVPSVFKLTGIAVVAVTVAMMIHALCALASPVRQLCHLPVTVNVADKERTYISQPFEVRGTTPVHLITTADLSNDWAELGISLRNERDQREYRVVQTLEYYSGTEDGEFWAEGDRKADTWISALPPGTYRILIDTDSSTFDRQAPVNWDFRLTSGGVNGSNLGLTVLALLIVPIFGLILHFYHESRRHQGFS